ncbi:uncharacterized protein A1O5_12423 [Cladophialophora psammophila CBS 110553]|uniref:Uncharacterized protein n=1 Tax=Cladophialophora psammophila CBS 110553 TaxID=1182543 RepID=W9VYU3_9EURO|nr:uncharacterized protein A1O5_12423 [Cladophialophora psammophila CBS 110553]EXJ57865.1 hypothetical protein A1O5_12423 [Cladophialophora psammophila CBS 110553]
MDNWWIWEVMGLLGSAAGLLAMLAFLLKYDGNQQPSWKQLSLNTVIAILSSLSKLLLFIPLTSAIGQLKWIWVAQQKRSLADLSVFDAASRGLIGSIQLLWLTRGLHLAAWGAIATILALGFAPFNQNLIHYYQDNVEEPLQVAYLANSSSYDNIPINSVLKANIYNSILNPNARQSWGVPQYACSSGNCTWDPVTSLEARSLCTDVTEHLRKQCHWHDGVTNCTLSIPDGAPLWYQISTSDKDWESQALVLSESFTNLVYKNATRSDNYSSPSLATWQSTMALGLDFNLGSATMSITNDTKWIATECSLEIYVRSVNASVRNAVYYETTLDTWSDTALPDVAPNGLFLRFIVPENHSLGVLEGDEFFLGWDAWDSIYYEMLPMFSGIVSGYLDDLDFGDDAPGDAAYNVLQALFIQNFTDCATPDEKLCCIMDNLAAAMSKTFRDSEYTKVQASRFNVSATDVRNTANMAFGRTLVTATFFRVHWQWLTLPLLVWILAAFTWIGTVFLTARTGLQKWRNNIIPLLFLYREGGTKADEENDVGGDATADVTKAELASRSPGVSTMSFVASALNIFR